MPVIFDSAPVFSIDKDEIIVKYLDVTKFLSLLYNKSLFFCRLDRLEDQFEGTTAIKNYDSRINWYKKHDPGMAHEEIVKAVNNYYEAENRIKNNTYINCWNNKEIESAALWKIYSFNGQGLRIKTTVQKLIDSLVISSENTRISKIEYIDYMNDTMPDGNSMYPIIHKHLAYNYENEVRLIYEENEVSNSLVSLKKNESIFGKYINVNIENLIDEIIVGPFSPPWITDLIIDISKKYGLETTIRKSELIVSY